MKLLLDVLMKQKTIRGFGKRLTKLRKSKGLTQKELGEAVGVSKRVIVYYEQDNAQPPGALLIDLAKALGVSTDTILGLKPIASTTSPKTARLLKRLRRIEELPTADQRAVLKFLEALLDKQEAYKHTDASKVA